MEFDINGRSIWSKVYLKSDVLLIVLYLGELFIVESVVLRSISAFRPVNIFLIYLGVFQCQMHIY